MDLRILKAHSGARLEALLRDVAYALRQMRRAPGIALLAIVCLGLGIGVNTAIFGVVNAVLLRPMAVVDPERLVVITRGQGEAFSYADYVTFRDDSRSLAGVAATVPMESDLHVTAMPTSPWLRWCLATTGTSSGCR